MVGVAFAVGLFFALEAMWFEARNPPVEGSLYRWIHGVIQKPQLEQIVLPALIGGVAAGFAGAVPFIGDLLNCLCCSLVIAGGFSAAYLLSREHARAGVPFAVGAGATVGALAGVIQGVVGAIVRKILPQQNPMETIETLEGWGLEFPEDARQSLLDSFQQAADPDGLTLLVTWVIAGLVFSTLGGLLGGAVFRTRSQHPHQS